MASPTCFIADFFTNYNKMGNFCATDIYKEIKERNPEQFEQFLVGQEVKKALNQRVTAVKTKVTTTADEIQKENLGVINSKEAQVKAQFEKAKADVERGYLGGVKGLEQTKNAKVEDLLGFSTIQKQFHKLKEDVTTNFTKEKERVQTEISAIQKAQTDKVNSSQPKLDYFDSLGDKLKSEVYEAGIKDYKDKIELQGKKFLTPLHQQLSVEHFTSQFKNLLEVDRLKSLTNVSKDNISSHLQSLIGKPEEGRAFLG